MKHSYIVAIGSNYNAEINIGLALEMLVNEFGVFEITHLIDTDPIGMPNNLCFKNGLVHLHSLLALEEVKLLLKEMEKKIGRTAEDKSKGIVFIDMDVIMQDNTIIDQEDYGRDYMQELLSVLNLKIDGSKN